MLFSINTVSVYPGSHLFVTVTSCQLRSTILFRNTWTSHSWWRDTSLTCASTSSSRPVTRSAYFSTTMGLFAWAQRNTMHPLRPTWWVAEWYKKFKKMLHRSCSLTYHHMCAHVIMYHNAKLLTVDMSISKSMEEYGRVQCVVNALVTYIVKVDSQNNITT